MARDSWWRLGRNNRASSHSVRELLGEVDQVDAKHQSLRGLQPHKAPLPVPTLLNAASWALIERRADELADALKPNERYVVSGRTYEVSRARRAGSSTNSGLRAASHEQQGFRALLVDGRPIGASLTQYAEIPDYQRADDALAFQRDLPDLVDQCLVRARKGVRPDMRDAALRIAGLIGLELKDETPRPLADLSRTGAFYRMVTSAATAGRHTNRRNPRNDIVAPALAVLSVGRFLELNGMNDRSDATRVITKLANEARNRFDLDSDLVPESDIANRNGQPLSMRNMNNDPWPNPKFEVYHVWQSGLSTPASASIRPWPEADSWWQQAQEAFDSLQVELQPMGPKDPQEMRELIEAGAPDTIDGFIGQVRVLRQLGRTNERWLHEAVDALAANLRKRVGGRPMTVSVAGKNFEVGSQDGILRWGRISFGELKAPGERTATTKDRLNLARVAPALLDAVDHKVEHTVLEDSRAVGEFEGLLRLQRARGVNPDDIAPKRGIEGPGF